MESRPFSLIIPSDLRYVTLARDFIEGVCRAACIDPAITDAVVLATNEAANNVVRHAHRDCPDALIEIQCRLKADGIEITILDQGAPFDLATVPALDPAELRVGGRGVYLMRSLMDELICERLGETGNRLRMVKHWQHC